MELMTILNQVAPTVDFENEKKLVSGGLLDSLSIVQIITECCVAYDIEFPFDELTMENFESYQEIEKTVKALIDAKLKGDANELA